MRILLVMDPFIPVPPLHYGGIERVIFDMANHYTKLGHTVTLIAGPNSKSPGRLITYGRNGALSKAINVKLLFEVYKLLHREIPDHDVIHNFGRLAFLAPFLKKRIRKVQTYMRYVDKKNIQRYDKFKPCNLVYTSVSDAITNTGKTERSEWHTIYNCVPIENYTFRDDVDPNGNLVFLGRIERCKGLHNAIKVAQQTNRRLVIAGNLSDLPIELEYFNNEIKPEIDNDKIKYIGKVDDKQKNDLLGNASALLTPVEWFEPFPIIIPEAYACGTPVLAFNNGGIAEGIEHGITGFLSSTVNEMIEHVNAIGTLSRKACRATAEQRFSDTKIAADYLSIYG